MNGITPSAASQQVNELERSLGVMLLDRSTRPLSLTAEGRSVLVKCAGTCCGAAEEFQASLDQLKSRSGRYRTCCRHILRRAV